MPPRGRAAGAVPLGPGRADALRRPRQIESFTILLAALLGTLVASSFLESQLRFMAGSRLLLSALYLAALAAVSGRPRVFWIGMLLGAPALGFEWLTLFTGRSVYVVANAVFSTAFLLFACTVIFETILRQPRVSADTVVGGVCIYLLIGVIFVELYGAVELLEPGSFAVGGVPLAPLEPEQLSSFRYSRFLYFSFVTLTTLGYGDVTPLSTWARGLAVLEAVVGPLYLAVFMARLVGLHLAAGKQSG